MNAITPKMNLSGLAVVLVLLISRQGLATEARYKGSHTSIPEAMAQRMQNISWHKGCPVSIQDLAHLSVSYWGFDGRVHQGEMIVNKAIAAEVVHSFGDLFAAKFPIERMELVSTYKGSDEASMNANNTSAFNCRWVTGRQGVYSKHSYGRAIDINPKINPYISKKRIEPKSGAAYTNRNKSYVGMIKTGGVCHTAFVSRGWKWGGAWRSVKDYQHFEKKR